MPVTIVDSLRRMSGPTLAWLVIASLASAGSLSAQSTGTVRGTVTSGAEMSAVIGACVAIGGPGCKALTDGKGEFVIRGLAPGEITLTITAIGQKPATRTVTVTAGRATDADIALDKGPLLLSSIIVTATRSPTEANKVANSVDVLTPEHIATSPARETQDLLREIPAVELPRTSSLVGGTAQIVSIRGVDEGRTVVLFDGIPVSDAWGEWIDWGRVPKGMLDRVEVVEGGTSNLYGNGAIGGVISFFSRPLAPGAAIVTLDAGSRDAKHGFGAVGARLAPGLTANLSGDYLEGGGYDMLDPAKRGPVDVPSEISQGSGYLRLSYTPSAKVSAFATGHYFGDRRHLGTPLGFQRRDQRGADFGLTYASSDRSTVDVRGWYGTQDEHQRSTTIRANSATCGAGSTEPRACEDSSTVADIPSRDWGASVLWRQAGLFGLESFSLGADYRHLDGTYDEVNFSTSCPGPGCGSITRTVTSGGDQDLSGAFAQAIAAPTDRLRIELGARIDYWGNNNGHSNDPVDGSVTYPDRSKTAFSPRVGARYEITRGLSVHSAVYRAFRAPNLAELYRKQINANASQITIPNPDLKPESGRGWEAGLDWQPAWWLELKGTYYIADYKDFNVPRVIDPGPPAIRQRLNVNKSRSKGGEAYLVVRPVSPLVLTVAGNWDQARVVSNDSTDGSRINRVPSPRYTVRATYTSRPFGTWTAMWRHEGETTTLQGATLAPFSVVDASVQREIAYGLSGFASLENIGDEQYQVNISGSGANQLISYGLPRTLRIGVTWTR